MRPRVILADDHVIVATGLGRLISEVADLIGQVSDGKQLVKAIEDLKPDIVVSDIAMPVMSGLDALRKVRAAGSSVRFIFLTVHNEPRLAAEAIKAGASGYLLKAAAGEELFDAISAAAADRMYLTPHITKDVLRTISQSAGSEQRSLTLRQGEILQLIVEGKRMKQIAAQMRISVRTVEDHKAHLLTALGARSTVDLVKLALKHGFVSD